jgi:hypothetical protein
MDVASPQSARAFPSHNSDIAFPNRLIADAKCRARVVLPLVNLTRGNIQSERDRATRLSPQCCAYRSRPTSRPVERIGDTSSFRAAQPTAP